MSEETVDQLERHHKQGSIEQMRATIDHIRAEQDRWRLEQDKWRAEQDKWRAEQRRETWRVFIYALIGFAVAIAAGAALWEAIRPPGF